jgi:hypothetical protein
MIIAQGQVAFDLRQILGRALHSGDRKQCKLHIRRG